MSLDTQPGDMVHRDEQDRPIRISREIPLPWLLGMLGALALQAIAIYYGQQEHARLLVTQQRSIESASAEIKIVAQGISTVNLSIVKHDMQIDDMRSRLSQIESQNRKDAK